MSDHPLEQLYPPERFPHFDGPFPAHPKLSDVMETLFGKTRAQNQLMTIAREELLACLWANERLRVRLQAWTARVDLPAIEHDIADFLDRVARRFGLARRGDLARHRRTPDTPIEDLLPEWYRLQDRLYTAYRRAGEVMDAAEACVRDEWKLPWPWLACRLAYDLFEQAHERALGVTFVRQRTSYLDDHVWGPWVPQMTFPGFEAYEGEPLAQAMQRCMDAAREHCQAMQARAIALPEGLPKGRWRGDLERTTRRNVRWVYEERICGKNRYAIAKVHHVERPDKDTHKGKIPQCSCYKNVKDGIRAAERLLGMSPYFF